MLCHTDMLPVLIVSMVAPVGMCMAIALMPLALARLASIHGGCDYSRRHVRRTLPRGIETQRRQAFVGGSIQTQAASVGHACNSLSL